MGKGSSRRPALVDEDEFEANWNEIFRRYKGDVGEDVEEQDGGDE